MQTEIAFVAPVGPLLMMLILYWSAVILYFRLNSQVKARDQVLRATKGVTGSPVSVTVRLDLMPLLAALLLPLLLALIFFR